MGINLFCKKTGRTIEMGYGGFDRLRQKVADLVGEPFASHYAKLGTPMYMFCLNADLRKKLYAEYNEQSQKMIDDKQVKYKIADFLFQPDCGGKISYGACKEILKVIGDYDDIETIYGYSSRPFPATFSDFKVILQECVAKKSPMVWH